MKKEMKMISPEVMDLLMKQLWPGNVRELENILVQGILYSKGDTLDLSNTPLEDTGANKSRFVSFGSKNISLLPYKEAKEKVLNAFNHDYIGAKLSMSKGNVTQAAKKSALDRQGLQQIMKRFDIDPDIYR